MIYNFNEILIYETHGAKELHKILKTIIVMLFIKIINLAR